MVGTEANQRAIGLFSNKELQGTDDNGLPRTGFARDDSEPPRDVPVEFLDEGEVPNP